MKNVLKNTMLGLVSCLCLVGCGTVVVDDHRCIGCGLCTTRCKFDAITLHRDHPEASTMVVAEKKFGIDRMFNFWGKDAMYVDNGVVKCGWTEPEFEEYG